MISRLYFTVHRFRSAAIASFRLGCPDFGSTPTVILNSHPEHKSGRTLHHAHYLMAMVLHACSMLRSTAGFLATAAASTRPLTTVPLGPWERRSMSSLPSLGQISSASLPSVPSQRYLGLRHAAQRSLSGPHIASWPAWCHASFSLTEHRPPSSSALVCIDTQPRVGLQC